MLWKPMLTTETADENLRRKCIVKECQNHTDEGLFIGNLCMPCHEYITEGTGRHSQAYRNATAARSSLTDLEALTKE